MTGFCAGNLFLRNPQYHEPNDSVETLDFEVFHKLAEELVEKFVEKLMDSFLSIFNSLK